MELTGKMELAGSDPLWRGESGSRTRKTATRTRTASRRDPRKAAGYIMTKSREPKGKFRLVEQTMRTILSVNGRGSSCRCTVTLATAIALSCSIVCQGGEIHKAARAGDLDRLKALLNDTPALLYSRDELEHRTPFHFAAFGGHKDTIDFLLSLDRNLLNSSDEWGATVLHHAVGKMNRDMATFFISRGADVNIKTKDLTITRTSFGGSGGPSRHGGGYSPLYLAANNGDRQTVDLLVSHGAVINSRAFNGMSPLDCAAKGTICDVDAKCAFAGCADYANQVQNGGGYPEIVSILLAHGADNVRDALDIARKNGCTPKDECTSIVKIIEDFLREHDVH